MAPPSRLETNCLSLINKPCMSVRRGRHGGTAVTLARDTQRGGRHGEKLLSLCLSMAGSVHCTLAVHTALVDGDREVHEVNQQVAGK